MNIVLAQRIKQVKPSPTLAVAAKALQMQTEGKDVIGLGTGEPDFDTPQHIKDAAIAAINAGFTKYTAVDGITELKQAVRDKFKRDNQLNYELNQILVSSGGKQSFYNLCQVFIEAGDEVIIPAYTFFASASAVVVAKAIPVIVEIDETLTLDRRIIQLRKSIRDLHLRDKKLETVDEFRVFRFRLCQGAITLGKVQAVGVTDDLAPGDARPHRVF